MKFVARVSSLPSTDCLPARATRGHARVEHEAVDAVVGTSVEPATRTDSIDERSTWRTSMDAPGTWPRIEPAASIAPYQSRAASTTCAPAPGELLCGEVSDAGVAAGDDEGPAALVREASPVSTSSFETPRTGRRYACVGIVPVEAIDWWWWMTSATMKFRNFSANAGSSCASSASARRWAICTRSRSGSLGGMPLRGLQPTDLLGELEALGEHVHERGVDVVDAQPEAGEFALGASAMLREYRAAVDARAECAAA